MVSSWNPRPYLRTLPLQPFDLVRVLSAWWVAVVAEGWWTEARGQQQYDSMDMAHVFRYQGLCLGTFETQRYPEGVLEDIQPHIKSPTSHACSVRAVPTGT